MQHTCSMWLMLKYRSLCRHHYVYTNPWSSSPVQCATETANNFWKKPAQDQTGHKQLVTLSLSIAGCFSHPMIQNILRYQGTCLARTSASPGLYWQRKSTRITLSHTHQIERRWYCTACIIKYTYEDYSLWTTCQKLIIYAQKHQYMSVTASCHPCLRRC